jgi:hypothetical protein
MSSAIYNIYKSRIRKKYAQNSKIRKEPKTVAPVSNYDAEPSPEQSMILESKHDAVLALEQRRIMMPHLPATDHMASAKTARSLRLRSIVKITF